MGNPQMNIQFRHVTAFTFGLLACAQSDAQGVTLDEAHSRAWVQIKIPVPDQVNFPQWTSIAPISFDLAVSGLSEGGSTAQYSATRILQQDQTMTQLRIEPIMEADGTVPLADPIEHANVDILARFTTPVPGPAFYLSAGIAAQLAGNPMEIDGFFPRFRMIVGISKVSTAEVVWLSQLQYCPGNQSCVLLDTDSTGFITGSLQGGETYDLRIVVIGSSLTGSYSTVIAPPMIAEPYVQIDFSESFDRLCADQNSDGMVTPADFNAWLANYNANDLKADVNQNAAVEPSDFTAWLAAFNLGLGGPYCTP